MLEEQWTPTETAQARQQFDAGLHKCISRGWVVQVQSDWNVQLIKPKSFSIGWFLAWTFFTLGAAIWLYPFYYMLVKKEAHVYLEYRGSVVVLRNQDGVFHWDAQRQDFRSAPRLPSQRQLDRRM